MIPQEVHNLKTKKKRGATGEKKGWKDIKSKNVTKRKKVTKKNQNSAVPWQDKSERTAAPEY